ncbi:MAG: transglutaminase domain-containing protein [Cyclobacteriaceae bacterium]
MKYLLYFTCLYLLVTDVSAQVADTSSLYRKADSIAASYPKHTLDNLKILTDKLTLPLATKKEKYRAIFMWVCMNIKSDYDSYLKNKLQRRKLQGHPAKLKQWNLEVNKIVFRKLRSEHQTICTGYAYLIREMAYHAGIESRIINGLGRSGDYDPGRDSFINHSWNAVKIDHEWLMSDATWSAGMFDLGSGTYVANPDDTYFLVDPIVFSLNHLAADQTDSLTSTTYLRQPYVHAAAIKNQLIPISPSTYRSTIPKGTVLKFEIQFEKPSCENDWYLLVGHKRYKGQSTFTESRNSFIDVIFDKKGKYKIHLMKGNEKAISYFVTVK